MGNDFKMSEKAYYYTNDRKYKTKTVVAKGIDGKDYCHILEIQRVCKPAVEMY